MKGAGKGVTREGAIRKGASEEITRGTHLTAMYPALFFFHCRGEIADVETKEAQNQVKARGSLIISFLAVS